MRLPVFDFESTEESVSSSLTHTRASTKQQLILIGSIGQNDGVDLLFSNGNVSLYSTANNFSLFVIGHWGAMPSLLRAFPFNSDTYISYKLLLFMHTYINNEGSF